MQRYGLYMSNCWKVGSLEVALGTCRLTQLQVGFVTNPSRDPRDDSDASPDAFRASLGRAIIIELICNIPPRAADLRSIGHTHANYRLVAKHTSNFFPPLLLIDVPLRQFARVRQPTPNSKSFQIATCLFSSFSASRSACPTSEGFRLFASLGGRVVSRLTFDIKGWGFSVYIPR